MKTIISNQDNLEIIPDFRWQTAARIAAAIAHDSPVGISPEHIAKRSISITDALIQALNDSEEKD